jgi:hypothetical protein
MYFEIVLTYLNVSRLKVFKRHADTVSYVTTALAHNKCKLVTNIYFEIINTKCTHLSHGGGKDSPQTRAKINKRHTARMLMLSISVRFTNTRVTNEGKRARSVFTDQFKALRTFASSMAFILSRGSAYSAFNTRWGSVRSIIYRAS